MFSPLDYRPICTIVTRGLSEDDTMPVTGERPGAGIYECDICKGRIELARDDAPLPPCPSCLGTEYVPVDIDDAA